MIASIQGRVAAVHKDHVVILVSGVGLKVYAPHTALDHLDAGDETFLHTVLIVREDLFALYGFAAAVEREIFETLLKVNGVGPRLALAILSTISVDHLRGAVYSEKADILMRVPGVGKKTAQKIILDLKDKLAADMADAPVFAFDDINTDVVDALVALGYSIVEAQTALQALPTDAPHTVEDRVRLALQFFG
ncbi:MAG: Holliday junction ATP-dependent DNA helicase RuvA [Chloroflexota bacterium]|nr:MAG: Holliday junction ATP-dependent DNA helicase RuvA [Chloroflexota bacterium]